MQKEKITLILMFIIGTITCISILFQSVNWFLSIITPVLLVLFIVIASLFLKKCFSWYASYMMNGRSNFHTKVDKPRIFLFSIFLPLLFIIVSVINSFEGFEFKINENVNLIFNTLFCTSLISLFGVILLLLFKTLGSSFENLYLPKVKEIVQKSTCDFKTKLSASDTEQIFKRLIKNGYLIYDDFDKEKEHSKVFVEVFVNGVLPSSPMFQLNMDYPQINVVYDCFQKITKDLDWIKFKKIFKSNENEINLSSRSSSVSRAKKSSIINKEKYYATDQNIIELIFDQNQFSS